jgi:tetratricopeptide (TPR) repeat protein
VTALLLLALAAGVAHADMSPPPAGPARATPAPPGPPSAERLYREGVAAHERRDFAAAVRAFEGAIRVRAAFPEAWNGLGFALRQQGRYAEAVAAYERALALRPQYVEALEYLGEAYVQMGKLDEARAVLVRLEPLDQEEAQKLRAAIERKR